MNNISFILFSYNEEERISYAIKNFIKYGEVIVLDGGSIDNTKDIVERLGAKFVLRKPTNKPYVENKENFELVLSMTTNDWIYWGYVDNIAPKALVEKMIEISKQSNYKRLIAPMKTYLWGNTEKCVQKSFIPVLFHRSYMNFDNNQIHSMGKFTGNKSEVLTLPFCDKYSINHFSLYNESKFINGYLKYAEEESISKYNNGERFSLLKMIAAMFRYAWIYRRSLFLGKVGFIIIFNFAFSRLMTYAKLYELENMMTLDSIEKKYSLQKQILINDFETN